MSISSPSQDSSAGSLPRLPLLYGVLSAVFFGSCAPMSKLFLGDAGPVSLAALFYLGSGGGMFVVILLTRFFSQGTGASEAPLTRSDIPYLAGMILFGGVFAPVILMYSMISTPAATGALLLNFESVVTAVMAAFFFHEAVGRRIWMALGLITLSCLILSLNPGGEYGISLGALGILVCCLFWALDNNISRYVSGCDPFATILVKGLGAGIITLCIAIAIGDPLPPLPSLPIYLTVGFFSFGGLASVFFLLALRSLGTARTGLFLSLSPFFGVFFSFLIFRESPHGWFVVALPIMATGTWLLVTENHSHLHRHDPLVHNHRHRHDDLHHDHQHSDDAPPLSRAGDHTHSHSHDLLIHDHPHRPDLHHRHDHTRDPRG